MLACALAFVSIQACAEEKLNSVYLQGNLSKNGSNKNGNVVAGYGRLIGQWQLDVILNLDVSSSSEGGTETMTMAGVGARYYFGTVGQAGATLPYARVELLGSHSSGGGGGTTGFYGAFAGLEHALTEQAAVYVEGGARRATGSDTVGSKTETSINFGINYRF
jgi:hypothetical protein